MKSDLTGQVSLVTGAGRGIGKAIADRLAANGSQVVYTDIDLDAAEAAAAEPGTLALRIDVTQPDEIAAGVQQIINRYGRIDILVNNAGMNVVDNRVPIDQFPRDEWDQIVDVNLTGAYEVSRAVAPTMIGQGSGRIINIASVAGIVPLRLQCAFVAAKAGLIALTRAMALELGPHGVLVNGIAPGSILTEGTRSLFYAPDGQCREQAQALLDHVCLGRPGSVDEVAVAAQFLADPENSYATGHVLTVDGGWTAGYHREF